MSAAPILTILKNGETIRSHSLDSEALVGRSEGCIIRLEDRAISRQHALFKRLSSGGVQVEKKSEFGPLFVNGAECTRAVIKEGDIVEMGPYLLRLQQQQQTQPTVQAQPAAAAPAPVITLAPEPEELAPIEVTTELSASSESDAPAELNLGDSASASDPLSFEEQPQTSEAPLAEAESNAIPDFNMGMADSPVEAGPMEIPTSSVPAPDFTAPQLAEMIDEDGRTKLTPQATLAVKLIIPAGAANHTEYEVTADEISIGRGKNCDVVLEDKKASRRNTIIRRAGLNFMIKDLDSANGTFVNGSKITEQELSGDDVIRIGGTEFQFKVMSADYLAKEKNFQSLPDTGPGVASYPPIGEDMLGGGYDPQSMGQTNPGFGSGLPEARGTLPGVSGVPGIESSIPGLTGVNPKQPKGLMEKFRALPKRRQYMVIAAVIAFLWLMMDEEPEVVKKPKAKPTAAASMKPSVNFDNLTEDQKKNVEIWHNLALDYYKKQDYDQALNELSKIFAMGLADYKQAREIERYAQEGKRKLEALQEEKRKKENEERIRQKIADLVDETRARMQKKEYDLARENFPKILELDPENADVANWRRQMADEEEQKKIDAQVAGIREQVNQQAWSAYREAIALKKSGRYRTAIAKFSEVLEKGASDEKLNRLSKKQIRICKAAIAAKRDPLLAQAKEQEAAGNIPDAYGLYKQATVIDPSHPVAWRAIERIRGALHERAKHLYTEAVLAESYSDFITAERKYREVLKTAPNDDIYSERAERKLAQYIKGIKKEE